MKTDTPPVDPEAMDSTKSPGSLQIELPDVMLRQCLKLKRKESLELCGTCHNQAPEGNGKQEEMKVCLEKKAKMILMTLKVTAMGGMFPESLAQSWKAVINSSSIITQSAGTSRVPHYPSERHIPRTCTKVKAAAASSKITTPQVRGRRKVRQRSKVTENSDRGNNTKDCDSPITVDASGTHNISLCNLDVEKMAEIIDADCSATEGEDLPRANDGAGDGRLSVPCDNDSSTAGDLNATSKLSSKDPELLIIKSENDCSSPGNGTEMDSIRARNVSGCDIFKTTERRVSCKEQTGNMQLTELRPDTVLDIQNPKTEPDSTLSYKCRHCSRSFKYRSSRKFHEGKNCPKRHLPSVTKCKDCGQEFSNKELYSSHREKSCNQTCNKCHRKCRTKQGLERHLMTCHAPEWSENVCVFCKAVFLSRPRLQRHILNKHKELADKQELELSKQNKFYPCKFCAQVFNNGSSRHRHQKFYCKVNPNSKKPLCCNHCGNFFTTKEELEEHRKRKHDLGTDYVCHICGKVLKARSSIYFHKLKMHSGQPPKHSCTMCDKAYYTRNKLDKHLTKHTDDRTVQCEMCGKQFKTPQHVAQHKKTVHENRYRFHCDKCGHGMEKLQYLKSHRCGRVRRVQDLTKTGAGADVEEQSGPTQAAPPTPEDHLVTASNTTAPSTYTQHTPEGDSVNQFMADSLAMNSLLQEAGVMENMSLLPAPPSLGSLTEPSHQPYILQTPNLIPPYVLPSNYSDGPL